MMNKLELAVIRDFLAYCYISVLVRLLVPDSVLTQASGTIGTSKCEIAWILMNKNGAYFETIFLVAKLFCKIIFR